jgi:hypothetical protein
MSDEEPSGGRLGHQPYMIIFFRPPGFYSDYAGKTIVEQIPIQDISSGTFRSFSFIITDRIGDGLCCSWEESVETGYTLYKGDRAPDNVIANSKFESSEKENIGFTILGGDSLPNDFTSEQSPELSFEVKVTIALDVYPDETGFYIEDALNRRVVDVPPGTYKDKQSHVEEVVTLEAGLYTFTIIDSFGDGINRADGFYRLQLANDDGRLPLVTGSGAFAAQESRVFVVEGDAATYPIYVRIPEGSSQLRFDVFRLDLVESDALVASQGTGEGDNTRHHVILVTEGSLYRIVFDSNGQDLDGSIEVNSGTNDPAVFKGLEYVVSPETSVNPLRWQVKLLAGQYLIEDHVKDYEILTLRMQFDRFPSEVEWILLLNDLQDNPWGRGLKERELLAYGPETLYDQVLEGEVVVETIKIPRQAQERKYTLIVTDAGSDGEQEKPILWVALSMSFFHTTTSLFLLISHVGLCCAFGHGGPVELFNGEATQGQLLFSQLFQSDRLVKEFVLAGASSSTTNVLIWPWVVATGFLLSILT